MMHSTLLPFDGEEQTIADWALDYGIPAAVIVARLERGLSAEQAITLPMQTAPGQKIIDEAFDRYIAKTCFTSKSLISHAGKTLTISAWANRLGMKSKDIQNRLCAGWSIERALNTPMSSQQGTPIEITHAGKTQSLSVWTEQVGIEKNALYHRLRNDWSIEDALNTPAGMRRKRPANGEPGVVSDFTPFEGTGAGTTAQETPEITFSEKARIA